MASGIEPQLSEEMKKQLRELPEVIRIPTITLPEESRKEIAELQKELDYKVKVQPRHEIPQEDLEVFWFHTHTEEIFTKWGIKLGYNLLRQMWGVSQKYNEEVTKLCKQNKDLAEYFTAHGVPM